jgi:membrane fusion protein (multidrug efflux system)
MRKKNQTYRYAYYAVVCVMSSLLWVGCSSQEPKKASAQSAQAMPAMQVSTFTLKPSNIEVSLEYPAKVKSVQQVSVVARVSGILEKKNFVEGSFVKAGDTLYQIDSDRYEALMQEALADVGVKEATLKQTTRDWERVKVLFEQDAVSQKERDSALSAYESAQASLKASQAALKKTQIDFGYTKVKAPISGITSLNAQDVGSYVGASSDTMSLTTITQMDPIYVEFSLPDIELLKKRYLMNGGNWNSIAASKLPVALSLSDGSSYEQKGTLDFLDSFVDSETSTIKARATFANPKNRLIPGLFTRVSIGGLVYKDALSIPQKALLQDALGSFVYVAKEGKAHKVPVSIGSTLKDAYIIDKGLKEGDVVITDNLTKLRPGAAVSVAQAKE